MWNNLNTVFAILYQAQSSVCNSTTTLTVVSIPSQAQYSVGKTTLELKTVFTIRFQAQYSLQLYINLNTVAGILGISSSIHCLQFYIKLDRVVVILYHSLYRVCNLYQAQYSVCYSISRSIQWLQFYIKLSPVTVFLY